MKASEGVSRAVEIALEESGKHLGLVLVQAILAIEVESQFNPERSVSISRVSEVVEAAIAKRAHQEGRP